MKYEVQIFTYDGWVNTWYVSHGNGIEEPETFDSYSEAWEAVREFINEVEDEIACGQRAPDEGHWVEEFRVMPVREGSA